MLHLSSQVSMIQYRKKYFKNLVDIVIYTQLPLTHAKNPTMWTWERRGLQKPYNSK